VGPRINSFKIRFCLSLGDHNVRGFANCKVEAFAPKKLDIGHCNGLILDFECSLNFFAAYIGEHTYVTGITPRWTVDPIRDDTILTKSDVEKSSNNSLRAFPAFRIFTDEIYYCRD